MITTCIMILTLIITITTSMIRTIILITIITIT